MKSNFNDNDFNDNDYVNSSSQAYHQQRDKYYSATETSWQTSWKQFKQALMEQNAQRKTHSTLTYSGIESQIQKFYGHLQGMSEFTYGLHIANTKERSNDPWLGQQLFNDGDMEVNLNVYFGDYPTPIHERARKIEAFIVLSGQAHIQHFTVVPTPIQSHYPIIKLCRGDSETLQHHDVCLLHSGINSVHEINPLTGRCVVLRISIFDSDKSIPCWYFPISPQQNEEFFTQRVKQY